MFLYAFFVKVPFCSCDVLSSLGLLLDLALCVTGALPVHSDLQVWLCGLVHTTSLQNFIEIADVSIHGFCHSALRLKVPNVLCERKIFSLCSKIFPPKRRGVSYRHLAYFRYNVISAPFLNFYLRLLDASKRGNFPCC